MSCGKWAKQRGCACPAAQPPHQPLPGTCLYVSNVLAPLAVCRCRAAMPICVLIVQNSATMMPSRPITAWLDLEGVWHEGCVSSKQFRNGRARGGFAGAVWRGTRIKVQQPTMALLRCRWRSPTSTSTIAPGFGRCLQAAVGRASPRAAVGGRRRQWRLPQGACWLLAAQIPATDLHRLARNDPAQRTWVGREHPKKRLGGT